MTVAEIKEDYKKKLFAIGEKMSTQQKYRVAIKANCTYQTVLRYMSGNDDDVRVAEKAEEILHACNEVLAEPATN